VNVPQASLAVSSTYFARVQYATTNASAATSSFSGWSSFGTASSFAIAPGTAYNGGYFGGQINDGGIIYNLIVSPAATGQNTSGIAWKLNTSADTNPPSQNEVYGFPMSQAGNSATYPAFQFVRGLSIGGYNDWYLPAKNELEVLYYFLKPDAASGNNANNTSSGSNPNAVAPEPVSTSYTASNPGQTTSSIFQVGGAQAFIGTFPTASSYLSSTEVPGVTNFIYTQNFINGNQNNAGATKTASLWARAIRREYANAPVAIGAAYGGGYFAGQYVDGGNIYNLVVAPLTSGSLNGQFGGGSPTNIRWKNTGSSDTNPPSQNAVYGKTATDTFGAIGAATYPMFGWCLSDATGPNGGAGIGGHTDWYIPAYDELLILMYNLGPNWTSATDFKAAGGTQAFSTTASYWSSTENPSINTSAWSLWPNTGSQFSAFSKDALNCYARAVRRVLVGPVTVPTIGGSYAGGYFAGQINDGGTIYNLIVAPKATGESSSTLQYKTTNSADANPNSRNEVYGKLATDQFNDVDHPAFQFAKGLSIGGFTDWYVPAKNELEILYYNLKPTTGANNTSSGINPNAVPPRASNYTASVPGQTTVALFQTGGSEALNGGAGAYWSATESSSSGGNAWRQRADNGNQDSTSGFASKSASWFVRAIRRVAA
jgi:hypothetical protein